MKRQVSLTELDATYTISYYQREQSLGEELGNGGIDLKIINLQYVRVEIISMGEIIQKGK